MSTLNQTDKLFFDQTGMDRLAVERIVQDALQGADDGELFLEYEQSENMVWDDGKLRGANFNTTQGFGLRSVCGETVGYAHAVNLDEAAIKRAAATVKAVKGGHAGTLALPPQGTNRLLYDDTNPLQGKSFEEKVKNALAKMPLAVYIIIGLVLFFVFVQMKTAEPVMPVYLQF